MAASAWFDHVSRHWLASKLPVKRPHTVIGAVTGIIVGLVA